jgi:hypothetical protein
MLFLPLEGDASLQTGVVVTQGNLKSQDILLMQAKNSKFKNSIKSSLTSNFKVDRSAKPLKSFDMNANKPLTTSKS